MEEKDKKGVLSDRVRKAIEQYEAEEAAKADTQITERIVEVPIESKGNFVVNLWNKLGKFGQILTLTVTILTSITALKPYAMSSFAFLRKVVHGVRYTEENTERIKKLEQRMESSDSIDKMVLYSKVVITPDGCKVKLYKTRDIDGVYVMYHYTDNIFYAANKNPDSGYYYYIDHQGEYHEIHGVDCDNSH